MIKIDAIVAGLFLKQSVKTKTTQTSVPVVLILLRNIIKIKNVQVASLSERFFKGCTIYSVGELKSELTDAIFLFKYFMICLIYNSRYKPAVSRTFAFHGHGLGPYTT